MSDPASPPFRTDFDEDVLLRVRATCACGRPLDRDDVLHEPAGTVSLARLLELSILAADLARCLCGAWNGRTGDSLACYRLPGGGPYIVSASRLEQRPRHVELSVRDQLPRQADDHVIAALSQAELDTASALGQPASVRAAWQEALFALDLGAASRSFPCGAGLRCFATTNMNAHGQLDLAVMRVDDGPSQWLTDTSAAAVTNGHVLCLIEIDPDVIEHEIEAEARLRHLHTELSGRRQIRVTRAGGHFAHTLNAERLLATAVGSGRLLRLQASHELSLAHDRLTALDTTADTLVRQLTPLTVNAVADDGVVILGFPRTDTTIDVGAYLDAGAADRAGMLANWESQAA